MDVLYVPLDAKKLRKKSAEAPVSKHFILTLLIISSIEKN